MGHRDCYVTHPFTTFSLDWWKKYRETTVYFFWWYYDTIYTIAYSVIYPSYRERQRYRSYRNVSKNVKIHGSWARNTHWKHRIRQSHANVAQFWRYSQQSQRDKWKLKVRWYYTATTSGPITFRAHYTAGGFSIRSLFLSVPHTFARPELGKLSF